MIERAGEAAKLGFKAHPHMLRHATGYALANAGHDTRALQSYCRLAEVGGGAHIVALHSVSNAAIVVSQCVVGVEPYGHAVFGDGTINVSLPAVSKTAIVVSQCVLGIEPYGIT